MIDPQVIRAQAGDAAALEAVLEGLAPAVRRFGMRMCKDPHDADDVLQDTLLAIATHLPEFEGRSSLSSWVFALTRTACARKRRGLKNRPPVADDADARPDEGPSPEERAADRELGGALGRALDALPDEQREVILLRDVEGLSAAEAAEAVGVSVDALKSRLHRARAALRAALSPLVDAPGEGCPDVALPWSRNVEGDLSAVDCAAMEAHLATCGRCSGTCDALKAALALCRRAASGPVPPEVQTRVRAAVRAWSAARVK